MYVRTGSFLRADPSELLSIPAFKSGGGDRELLARRNRGESQCAELDDVR